MDLPDLDSLGGKAGALSAIVAFAILAWKRMVTPISKRIAARREAKRLEEQRKAESQETLAMLKTTVPPLARLVSSTEQVIKATRNDTLEIREQLAHMEHRARISMEMIGLAMMRADPSGEVVDADRAMVHLTGRATEELVGYGWFHAVVQGDRARVMDSVTNAVRNGSELKTTFTVEHLSGSTTIVRFDCRPRRNSNGEVLEYLMVFGAGNRVE